MLQEREYGTPVSFNNEIPQEIDLQKILFTGDTFGLYALQSVPVTVSTEVRDALFGSLDGLAVYVSNQRMPVKYLKLSWNETAVSEGYLITDLLIGVVSEVSYAFNTGPAFLIDALKSTWLGPVIAAMGNHLPWQSWKFLESNPYGEAFARTHFIMVDPEWSLPSTQTPPNLAQVASELANDSEFQSVIVGDFVIGMANDGIPVAFLGSDIQVAYKMVGQVYYQNQLMYLYKTYVRVTVDYRPVASASPLIGLITAILTWLAAHKAVALVAMLTAGISVGLALGVPKMLDNLSHSETTQESRDYVTITVPPGGTYTDPISGDERVNTTGEDIFITYEQVDTTTTRDPENPDFINDAAYLIGLAIAGVIGIWGISRIWK